MAAFVHSLPTNFSFKSCCRAKSRTRDRNPNSFRCERTVEKAVEKRLVTVKSGDDSLQICRVLNGMWQTSGGWGRIDRDDAVDAMLRYADAGLSTFDMADHC